MQIASLRVAPLDREARHLAVELGSLHPERARGGGGVAAVLLERALDLLARELLRPANVRAIGRLRRGRRRRAGVRLERAPREIGEVLEAHARLSVPARARGRVLDLAPELAHVPRPRAQEARLDE